MSNVNSTIATSRRSYLSQAELAQYANITITDETEADDRISQAEEIIDAFVGFQDKFIDYEISGKAAGAGAGSLTLDPDQQNKYDVDFFKWCQIEIIGGTGEGQRRKITGSTREGVVTLDSNWTSTPDTTSFYKIHQLGKFPRIEDIKIYSTTPPTTYLKTIPEAVKRAVAAQVEFLVNMGDNYFGTNQSDKQSERIGDYSYELNEGTAGADKLIAPKAKLLLRGIKNRLGTLTL